MRIQPIHLGADLPLCRTMRKALLVVSFYGLLSGSLTVVLSCPYLVGAVMVGVAALVGVGFRAIFDVLTG